MKAATPPSGELVGLLGRIDGARNLPEALAVLMDAVVAPRGVGRALVLLADGDALTGVAGLGWDPETARTASVPLDDEAHPLIRAFRSGTRERVTEDGREGPLGLRRYEAIPLRSTPAADGSSPPFGLLVLDHSGEPGAPRVEEISQWVERLGPALFRAAERDRLRGRSADLDRQLDLHAAIINALPDPVLITDAHNRILLENQRAEYLFNTSEGDSEGRRRAVEINNLLFSSFLARSADARNESGGRELNLVDPSEGGDLLFEVLSTPLSAPQIGNGALVSVLRDVTDLKRAATELEHQFKCVRQAEVKSRRERDRLNLILENVGDPILVMDDRSNIILMNREAERLFEVPPDADPQSSHRRDIRTNDTKFSSLISDFALSPDQTRVAEVRLTDPETGAAFPAEVVAGKILNERVETTAIVSVLHDLTKAVENERLAAELAGLNEGLEDRIRAATVELEERNRRLEWQSRELERAYRLKSEFLASMSHELRTPINALLGYAALMKDGIYGPLTERQEESLDRMYAASQHLLELINDILDLAKIEAGKMPVNVEPLKIGQLIRDVELTIEPMVRSKKLEYIADVPDDLPSVRTDRTKVRQIILNLLSNAVKFTHDGSVRVRARPGASGGVEIAVSDTGIGIAPEDTPKIFEDFRQVDQSSTREYGGTGLGLSITKKLLALLGGTIRVDSCPGEGSTFTVWLPPHSEEMPAGDEVAKRSRTADRSVVEVTRRENC